MPDTIKELHPTARKEYKCMFCGCKIEVGERYQRDTLKYDGTIYDWVSHDDCSTLTGLLDMYGRCDEGIGKDDFQNFVWEYLMENYRDEETDDVREDVGKLSYLEQVRLIIADWDKPEFEIKRLKREMYDYEYREKVHALSKWAADRLSAMRTRLEYLEDLIKKEA